MKFNKINLAFTIVICLIVLIHSNNLKAKKENSSKNVEKLESKLESKSKKTENTIKEKKQNEFRNDNSSSLKKPMIVDNISSIRSDHYNGSNSGVMNNNQSLGNVSYSSNSQTVSYNSNNVGMNSSLGSAYNSVNTVNNIAVNSSVFQPKNTAIESVGVSDNYSRNSSVAVAVSEARAPFLPSGYSNLHNPKYVEKIGYYDTDKPSQRNEEINSMSSDIGSSYYQPFKPTQNLINVPLMTNIYPY